MVDVNAAYYTFSTIAQTLAGAFGFLVAVVLYRIAAIGEAAKAAGTHLLYYRDIPETEEVNHLNFLLREGCLAAFLKEVAPYHVKPGNRESDRLSSEGLRDEVQRYADSIVRIKHLLKWAISYTGATVLWALTMLPITGLGNEASRTGAVAVGLIASAACLGIYCALVWDVARKEPERRPMHGRKEVTTSVAAPRRHP